MSPRYMGGFGVVAKSMARIHETVSSERAQMLLAGLYAEVLMAKQCWEVEFEETGHVTVVLRRQGGLRSDRRGPDS